MRIRSPPSSAPSLLLALALTPACRALARAAGLLDRPNSRKAHDQPVPLLGGCAILGAFAVVVLARGEVRSDLWGILAGAAIAFLLGMVDDHRGMHPFVKLGGQTVAAAVVVARSE